MMLPVAAGEMDKKLPEPGARFLESIKTGIQKDFYLNVLYYETDVEESNWSLLRNAHEKKEEANVSNTISGKLAVISESDVKQMIDYLVKAHAFHREPHFGEGTPHQGWTISLHNGESNLRWYLGKDRRAMAQAKDLIGLQTLLKGEAKELLIAIAAHSKK